MNKHLILAMLLLGAFGMSAGAQDRGQRDGENKRDSQSFNEHDQQVTHDWYSKHQNDPPAGFRKQDRFSADQESRLREGAVLDGSLRNKVHSAPGDLTRKLPPPPPQHRYVAVGDHLALIDNGYNVKAVIHLH
jgi:Ni/Co efflux regulator RcnB